MMERDTILAALKPHMTKADVDGIRSGHFLKYVRRAPVKPVTTNNHPRTGR